MRRLFFACLVSAMVLGGVGAAWATNGMQVIGLGPVARSMGGATVGLPLDSSIVLSNPAGLSELSGRLDFGVTYFVPKSSYKAYDVTPGIGGGVLNRRDSDTGASPMPAFGLVLPINDRLTFGLGAYGTAGMGVDYVKGLYSNTVYTNFQMMKFAPGLSYKVNESLSLGVALNADFATLEYNAGRSMTTGAIVAHDSNSQIGVGYQVGALYKLNPTIQFGLAYISKQVFNDFSFNTPYGQDHFDFDLPQNVVFGVGLNLTPKLKVAADVRWINWADTMGQNKPSYTQNASGSGSWNCNWENQVVYSLGVQYALLDTLRLRAGFNYGKNPLPTDRAFEGIAFPAIQETHYTMGLGWDLTNKLELNVGFMYAPKVTMAGSNYSQGIMSYETDLTEYSLELGLSYKF